MAGRSPHGERGLKSRTAGGRVGVTGRSPHGERGLKFQKGNHGTAEAIVALLMESVD